MNVHGLKGDWYEYEYTVKGSFNMRTHKIRTTDTENLLRQLMAAAAIKSGCNYSDVEIYQVFRMIG